MTINTKARYTNEQNQRERECLDVAREAATEGIVLLKNEGVLPIAPQKIALFGAGAGMTIKGGTGSGEVNERHAVTILEGLEDAGFEVTTKGWIDEYARLYKDGEEAFAKEFRKRVGLFNIGAVVSFMFTPYLYPYGRRLTDEDIEASGTDACIYVVARQAGEGADRKLDRFENDLSEDELHNIRMCAAAYKKFVVVINVGATFNLGFLDEIENIGAVVFFCQQGSAGGAAFADIVSGKVSPSGRLAVSWAAKYDDIPFAREFSYLNGDVDNEYYKEGIFVGYRYFDSFGAKPRFEFGHGLSYTQFEVKSAGATLSKTKATVHAEVRNVGKTHSAKEVAQLYVSCPQGMLQREYQHLAAFAKTSLLAPGETETLRLEFDFADLAGYDEGASRYILEKGEYILRLGQSSRNTTPCAVVALDNDVVVSEHRRICPPQSPIDELTLPPAGEVSAKRTGSTADLLRLSLKSDDFETVVHKYDSIPIYSDEKVDALIGKLSVKDMVGIVVGSGMFGGKRHFDAPGAAGSTTSALVGKGIKNVLLADGPAGLRLQRTSAVTKSGKVKMIDAQIAILNMLPKYVKRFMFGNPKKDTLIYQYTTAFPVEMAMAQTWNLDLLERMGRSVGREMAEYGVTYWLAPGMNIHRNPLCGRNFEYYSEDPLLSGKMAAAAVRGLQSTPGCFATIKHYVCNDMEDNRNKVSSNLSERALREIYLKGFGIAVKEGGARSVMTSYNRVNGVYAPNSRDLCTAVLRNEWGFGGVVMTDWFSTGKGLADAALALAAGNDLMMPGSKDDKKAILAALKGGTLSVDDLRRSCALVLRDVVEGAAAQN
uniref:Beta-glucosidase n=1 Tax=uncultured bacterium contig00107 TaxID=1181573 RepID=A0A806KL75_9BACT|nr:beta-glucosidase [uncultured bacterium contig00107]